MKSRAHVFYKMVWVLLAFQFCIITCSTNIKQSEQTASYSILSKGS